MKKWLLIGVGGIVVLIIVALIIGLTNLGPIIKKAINTYGPGITKTKLHVDDVDVSIFSSEATIEGFFLGNPKGFSAPEAMRVDSIYVNLDKKSIASNVIVINRIVIKQPSITYERTAKGDNFQAILQNVQGPAKPAPKEEKVPKEGPGKKVIIKDLLITGAKVKLLASVAGLGQKAVTASLPEIHLNDIGKKEGGESMAKAAEKILNALYTKLRSPEFANSIKEQLKALGADVQKIEDKAKEAVSKGKQEAEKLEQKAKDLSSEGKKTVDELKEKAKGFLGR